MPKGFLRKALSRPPKQEGDKPPSTPKGFLRGVYQNKPNNTATHTTHGKKQKGSPGKPQGQFLQNDKNKT
jgi:hypothetical protein